MNSTANLKDIYTAASCLNILVIPSIDSIFSQRVIPHFQIFSPPHFEGEIRASFLTFHVQG